MKGNLHSYFQCQIYTYNIQGVNILCMPHTFIALNYTQVKTKKKQEIA